MQHSIYELGHNLTQKIYFYMRYNSFKVGCYTVIVYKIYQNIISYERRHIIRSKVYFSDTVESFVHMSNNIWILTSCLSIDWRFIQKMRYSFYPFLYNILCRWLIAFVYKYYCIRLLNIVPGFLLNIPNLAKIFLSMVVFLITTFHIIYDI